MACPVPGVDPRVPDRVGDSQLDCAQSRYVAGTCRASPPYSRQPKQ